MFFIKIAFPVLFEKGVNMKKNLPSLILLMLCAISLSGCNSDNSSSDIFISEFAETTSVSETTVISDTAPSSDTTLNYDTSDTSDTAIYASDEISDLETILENSDISSENQTDAEETDDNIIFFSHEFDMPDTTDNYDGLKLYYNSDEIPDECITQTAQYFKSMQNKDSLAYQSFLIPMYRDYLTEYLSESDYDINTLLNTYYDNISSVTDGDFTFSKIEMKRLYEEDYEELNIPDYITSYKSQLDEISEEKDGSHISETFGECFSVVFNLYAKSQGNEYNVINSNIISFFEADGKYYIMMA